MNIIPKTVYFLGIGGIGMSALARWFHAAGSEVSGYDKTPTALTEKLQSEGIPVHYTDSPELIPANAGLIIYTPAIPKDLNEFVFASSGKFNIRKRAEVLGDLTNSRKTIAVAGTHGKTTVSTMISHIMYNSHLGCTSFLGGISKNYDSNLLLMPESEFMVAEADEFDRSFLKLTPWLAIITSADADHLDIYSDHQDLKKSFSEFTSKVKPEGYLLIKQDLGLEVLSPEDAGVFTYALTAPADFYAQNLRLEAHRYIYDLVVPEGVIKNISPELPGMFNVENSIAAAAAAWLSGVEESVIRDSIGSFSGVKRRFDIRLNRQGILYIDDYAHHPEELKACITSVKMLFPGRHITGVFQPHLFTRTRDFAKGFSESLSLLDRAILLDIYPAREKPIEGVTSAMLLPDIASKEKLLISKESLIGKIKNLDLDILLTLGAGDIDQLVEPIEDMLNQNLQP